MAQGRPLSAEQVVELRDRAVCMMMRPSTAEALRAKRGFRDVVPEDCWADWHRLRVQMVGQGYLPKLVLCLAVGDSSAEHAVALLEEAQVEHELRAADPRLVAAFDASAFRYSPSFDAADRRSVEGHRHVIYFLSPNFVASDALATSGRFLQLGARLLAECGGGALKCESSGIAHGKLRWLELAAQHGAPTVDASRAALVQAFVQSPIAGSDDFWSCGMHLLGRPDMIATADVLGPDASALDFAELFDVFAHYLVCECGDQRHFASGATFRTSAEEPRLRVTWEACTGYDEDDFFFNPFGRWRFASS